MLLVRNVYFGSGCRDFPFETFALNVLVGIHIRTAKQGGSAKRREVGLE